MLSPAWLGKELGLGLARLAPLQWPAIERKKQLVFNNPRSSILPESAPDPIFYSNHSESFLFLRCDL